MAPYGTINDPLFLHHPTPHKRSIFFSDSPIFKLKGKVTKRFLMLGHNHDTRGVLVQPVDNSGASLSSDALQVWTVVEKGCHRMGGGEFIRSAHVGGAAALGDVATGKTPYRTDPSDSGPSCGSGVSGDKRSSLW